MIDVYNITNFRRNRKEIEEFLLLAICVAGKTAYIQAKKLNEFLTLFNNDLTPFENIKASNKQTKYHLTNKKQHNKYHIAKQCTRLEVFIKRVKLGQYNKLIRAFIQAAELNPYTCTIKQLENIYGVSSKTSRFFLIHSRENFIGAALDTHILKYLRENGYPEAPVSTPIPNKYEFYEKAFLKLIPNNKTIAEFDLDIWRLYGREEK